MKTRLGLRILIGVGLSLCVCVALFARLSSEKAASEKAIREVIEDYYAYAYESVVSSDVWRLPDLSPYMDMNQIQCQNIRQYLASQVFGNKALVEEGLDTYLAVGHPYRIDFRSIDLDKDGEAVADVSIAIDETKTYPQFILQGENTFRLHYDGERWKITNWTAGENTDTSLFQALFSSSAPTISFLNADGARPDLPIESTPNESSVLPTSGDPCEPFITWDQDTTVPFLCYDIDAEDGSGDRVFLGLWELANGTVSFEDHPLLEVDGRYVSWWDGGDRFVFDDNRVIRLDPRIRVQSYLIWGA